MIPKFNMSGVLPPFVGNSPTDRVKMSPYDASMSELTDRFGISRERFEILQGFPQYREKLVAAGFQDGFELVISDSDGRKASIKGNIDKKCFKEIREGVFGNLNDVPGKKWAVSLKPREVRNRNKPQEIKTT